MAVGTAKAPSLARVVSGIGIFILRKGGGSWLVVGGKRAAPDDVVDRQMKSEIVAAWDRFRYAAEELGGTNPREARRSGRTGSEHRMAASG